MSNKVPKPYALSISVKPKSTATNKYSTITIKGIAIAQNPKQAKDMGLNMVLNSFSHYDGSSPLRPVITIDNLTVKECKLYGDFVAKPE